MTRIGRRALLSAPLTLLVLPACGSRDVPAEVPPPEEAAATVFVFRPDLAAGRAAGTIRAGTSEAAALLHVGEILRQRMRVRCPDRSVSAAVSGGTLEIRVSGSIDAEEAASLAAGAVRPGSMGVWIQASASDGFDLDAEMERLAAWRAANPASTLDGFHGLAPADGGPSAGLRWIARTEDDRTDGMSFLERCLPVLVPADAAWRFGAQDLLNAYPSRDRAGYPSIGFEFVDARKGDFGAFTEAHIDRAMVIELDGECVSVAFLNERLPGQGIIMGRFTDREVDELIGAFRAGELPVPVEVVEIR